MDLEINIWAVVLALVASMVVGFVWYAKPVFGTVWMKLVGITEKQAQAESGKAFAKMIPSAFVEALLVAASTAVVAAFYPENSWLTSAFVASVGLWVAQATAMVVHDAFELRPFQLTMIHVGNQLATLLAMGLVVGLLQP